MARNGFQNATYIDMLGTQYQLLNQVRCNTQSILALITNLKTVLAQMVASQTTPNPKFGTADQADIDALTSWLDLWDMALPSGATMGSTVQQFIDSGIGS